MSVLTLTPRHAWTVKRTRRWPCVRFLIVRCSPLALVLLASGCVSGGQWEQRRDQPRPMKPSDPVLIWSNGTVEKWHGVVITPDSVSGILYGMPLTCDSCRRSIPRAQVDSIKVGHKTGAKEVAATSLILGGALTVALLLEVVVCEAIGFPKEC